MGAGMRQPNMPALFRAPHYSVCASPIYRHYSGHRTIRYVPAQYTGTIQDTALFGTPALLRGFLHCIILEEHDNSVCCAGAKPSLHNNAILDERNFLIKVDAKKHLVSEREGAKRFYD